MVKRVSQIDGVKLYDIIKSRANVLGAIKDACRDHAKDPAVINIKENPDKYADVVQEILETQNYRPSGFKQRRIFERGKWRELCYTRTFPDRIIQHCVLRVVAPILLGTCIRDSYAAIKGRGLHAGSVQIRKDLRADPDHTRYCLKIDVKKYFPSINREFLFQMVKRKIKCGRTLSLLETIIFECPGDSGLPIGMYPSQIFSAFYLCEFDRYCKQTLGLRHYYRYMDDIVVLGSSKNVLWNALRFMRRMLSSYGLTVKSNWQIFPLGIRGLDFMGFVFRHSHTRIRKRNKVKYIRVCNHIVRNIKYKLGLTAHMFASKISYEGMLNWCDSRNLLKIHGSKVYIALEFGPEALK